MHARTHTIFTIEANLSDLRDVIEAIYLHCSNMYTLMVTNSKSGAAKMVMKAPKKFQPATYLLLHCLLCSFTIALSVCPSFYRILHSTHTCCSYRYYSCKQSIIWFHIHEKSIWLLEEIRRTCEQHNLMFASVLQAVFWHHKLIHTLVLILCCAISAWNGAFYYFDIFAHRYVDSVGVQKNVKKA